MYKTTLAGNGDTGGLILDTLLYKGPSPQGMDARVAAAIDTAHVVMNAQPCEYLRLQAMKLWTMLELVHQVQQFK